MRNSLYFAAKTPLPGEVKTRLGARIGMEAASRLYRAFLADLSARFAQAPFEVAWYVAPGSWPYLRPIVGAAAHRSQRGGDFARRQANLFRGAFGRAATNPVILAGTDSPQLTRERVSEAFACLAGADVVFGPTHDGGYYLVGMRRFHDLFTGIEMSTSSVLDQALARARALRLRVGLLEPEFDVDVEADLELLLGLLRTRSDLPASRAALAAIGWTGVAA